MKFNEILSSGEGQKLQKILAIDGKTQCGNGNKNQKANHIVSVVDENGICLGQTLVQEKSNEITAIPKLLDDLNIKGQIITIDAMGTQTEIVGKTRSKIRGLPGIGKPTWLVKSKYTADADLDKPSIFRYIIIMAVKAFYA